MSNMSYCMFENTSSDLSDCVRAMEEAGRICELDMSQSEMEAFEYMAHLCKRFLAEHERLMEGDDE